MTANRSLIIAIYSDDSSVRNSIKSALGKRVSVEFAEHKILEFATGNAVKSFIDDKKSADIFILDGEATPAGGMGMSRQLKDEIYECPPILVLIARAQDAWLATWSRADAVAAHPINAIDLAMRVGEQLQRRVARAS